MISNAFVVGEKREYLIALLTLKTEVDDESGKPKDHLHIETKKWLKSLGLEYLKLSELLVDGPHEEVRI